MGRAAMFVVMGFGLAAGFISMNIRNATNLLTESQVGYHNYSIARNLARTGIQRSLRYIDLNPLVANYTPPTSGSFNGGSYTVSTTLSQDTMWLNVTGTYADTNYVMRTKLLRSTKPFPIPTGAMSIKASPVNFTTSGNPTVDGRNYDSSGTTIDSSKCATKPGIAVQKPSDSTTIMAQTAGGSNQLQLYGNPGTKVDTATADPAPFIDEYEANADYIFNTPGNVSGNQTLGTADAPAITVCNAGEDTAFSITFVGSITGWGILAINGSVVFKGGVDFHGLVIAYGRNNVVNFGEQGTPKIVGGIIVAGSAASVTLKGTGSQGKLLYSCDALNKAKNVAKLRYYSVLEWYE